MTQFTKERGESQNMTSDSYTFTPAYSNVGPKETAKEPKAKSWTPEQSQAWFNSVLKLKHTEMFIENQIDGETLMELSDMDLQELGMPVAIHRNKTLKAIEKLKTEF